MEPITAQEIVDILEARYAELQAGSTLEKAARLNELEIVLSRIDVFQRAQEEESAYSSETAELLKEVGIPIDMVQFVPGDK